MAEEQTLININLAQAEVLARLPGIGEHLAARIVAHRETAGPFREVMGLTAVSGISERMVQEFANQITVGSLDEPQPEGEANGIVVSIPVGRSINWLWLPYRLPSCHAGPDD